MLTGGRDTYGAVGQAFCYLCWTSNDQTVLQAVAPRRVFLEAVKTNLEKRLKDLEDEAASLRQQMDSMHFRIHDVEMELDGGRPCAEEEDDLP